MDSCLITFEIWASWLMKQRLDIFYFQLFLLKIIFQAVLRLCENSESEGSLIFRWMFFRYRFLPTFLTKSKYRLLKELKKESASTFSNSIHQSKHWVRNIFSIDLEEFFLLCYYHETGLEILQWRIDVFFSCLKTLLAFIDHWMHLNESEST